MRPALRRSAEVRVAAVVGDHGSADPTGLPVLHASHDRLADCTTTGPELRASWMRACSSPCRRSTPRQQRHRTCSGNSSRLCAEHAGARERLRDGSLSLSAAAELRWAFDRQRRRSIGGGPAREHSVARTAGSAGRGGAAEAGRFPRSPGGDHQPPAAST